MSVYDEIDTSRRAVYKCVGRDPPSQDGFRELLQEAETEARGITATALQPHLAIFELGLEFLSYVHVALSPRDGLDLPNSRSRSAWALVGAAVSFGVSIRSLLISGLDTPARALLRSYTEALFLCIAVLHDPTLGEAYAAAQTDDQIKDFWHRKASPKKLHETIISLERKIGLNEDAIDDLREWRRQEYEILSQSSHLSYLAAALTAWSPRLDGKASFAPAIFGQATAHSPRTLFYAMATTWYFSRLSNPVLLGKKAGECAIVFEKENEWHQQVIAARDILSDMTLRYWEIQPKT